MFKKTRVTMILIAVFILSGVLSGCSNAVSTQTTDTPPEATQPEAAASNFPNKPIEWIIPYGAGGSSDLAVRSMASAMSETLKEAIIPTNKAGAGGITAAEYSVKRDPDGYNIIMGNVAMNGIQLAMDSAITYDNDDFTFICMYLIQEPMIVVSKSSPYKTLDDLIAAAKANPGKLTYSTSGVGTSLHLTGELLQKSTDIELTHVPFASGPESLSAIMGGHVDFGMHLSGDAKSMIESGEIRALAVLSPERIASMPDFPTMTELGYPDATFVSWHGIVGPAGIPQEAVNIIAEAAKTALESPSVTKLFEKIGVTPSYMGPEKFKQYVYDDYSRIAEIVEKAGLKK